MIPQRFAPFRASAPLADVDPPRRTRRIRRSVSTAVVTLIGGVALVAAPAAQAGYVGAGADAKGDAATGDPGHDIIGAAIAYDPDRGELRAQIRLAGTPNPASNAELNVFAGRRGPAGCNVFPAIGFSGLTAGAGTVGVRLNGATTAPDTVYATKSGTGEAVQEFTATARTFKGLKPNCVIATTYALGTPTNVYDTAGPYAVRGVPGLDVQLGKTPSTMRPGQTRTIRLTLRNPGHAKTGRIRLSVGKAKGLTVRHARSVASIAGGKRRTVALRVSLSRQAKSTTKLKVTATAPKKLTANANANLYLKKPSSGGGGGSGDGPKLCYRYTWYPPYGELQLC